MCSTWGGVLINQGWYQGRLENNIALMLNLGEFSLWGDVSGGKCLGSLGMAPGRGAKREHSLLDSM